MNDKLFTKADLDAAVELRTREAATLAEKWTQWADGDKGTDAARFAVRGCADQLLALLTTSGTAALEAHDAELLDQNQVIVDAIIAGKVNAAVLAECEKWAEGFCDYAWARKRLAELRAACQPSAEAGKK